MCLVNVSVPNPHVEALVFLGKLAEERPTELWVEARYGPHWLGRVSKSWQSIKPGEIF